jgi:hypothetical protein
MTAHQPIADALVKVFQAAVALEMAETRCDS